jgi:hypothetical protein
MESNVQSAVQVAGGKKRAKKPAERAAAAPVAPSAIWTDVPSQLAAYVASVNEWTPLR